MDNQEIDDTLDEYLEEAFVTPDKPENKRCAKRSVLWKFFTVSNNNHQIAICSICQGSLSFRSTSNLKKHMRSKHSDVKLDSTEIESAVVLRSIDDLCSDQEFPTLNDDDSEGEKGSGRRRRSVLWKYFTRLKGHRASCNLCRRPISSMTTTNLKRHILNKHSDITIGEDVMVKDEMEVEYHNIQNIRVDKNDETKSEKNATWKYFERVGDKRKYIAKCLICNLNFSAVTSSNLKKHLARKHPEISIDEEGVQYSNCNSAVDTIMNGGDETEKIRFKKRKSPINDIEDSGDKDLKTLVTQEALIKLNAAKELLRLNRIKVTIEKEKLDFNRECQKIELQLKRHELQQMGLTIPEPQEVNENNNSFS